MSVTNNAGVLEELSNLVRKSAPILGGLLVSPFGTIASSLVSGLFGAGHNDLEDLVNKIKNDPEASLKLKELELTHEKDLQALASQDYQTEVDDRKSARARQIAIHDYVPTILAIGFLINYAAIQFYCVMHQSSANDIISARFQDVLIMIVSYYFGSSHGRVR